jgi:hypothetical protein
LAQQKLVIMLPDDDFEAFTIICNVAHFRIMDLHRDSPNYASKMLQSCATSTTALTPKL